MRRFEYVAPASIEEAIATLALHPGEAKLLAGGQSLIPLINYRLARPGAVVDINGLPLETIHVEPPRLRLGALTRHAALVESPEIQRECPILSEAASLIGNVRVRSLGTLGGSLAHADPTAELPTAMIALDARLTLQGRAGTRIVNARNFFTGYLSTTLAPDEILTEVDVPVTGSLGSAVEEFSRRPGDFAIVVVAALIGIDRRGRVDDARLAFGGVAASPVRARVAEDALRGVEPSAEPVQRAAEIARDALHPASDAFVSAGYRKLLAGVLARRALSRAVARALGGG